MSELETPTNISAASAHKNILFSNRIFILLIFFKILGIIILPEKKAKSKSIEIFFRHQYRFT